MRWWDINAFRAEILYLWSIAAFIGQKKKKIITCPRGTEFDSKATCDAVLTSVKFSLSASS